MKKIVLIGMLILSTLSFGMEAHLRFGGVSNGKKYSSEERANSYSLAVGAELTQSLVLLDVGVGIQYNRGNSALDMDTVPAYILARYNIIPFGVKPYLVGKIGNTIHSSEKITGEDPKATYFYGLGFGVNFSVLQGEVLYSITKVEDSKKFDTLNQVSVMMGYRF